MSAGLTIFDCDGVLVDSEEACNRVLVADLAALGFAISLAECMARFVGKSMLTVQAELEADAGLTFPAGWPEAVRARTIATLEREKVPAIPGVRAVLESHRAAGRPYCVASSGRIEKMRATLGGSGLAPLFDEAVLFSSTMVARGKPAPDLFLHAAATMGHAPEACTVVEDSLPGVQGASAAGMRVLAFCGAAYADVGAYRALGAEVFTEMAALPGLLGLPA
jgi:HAD superfamily hydrolase (TIGR01509 family)